MNDETNIRQNNYDERIMFLSNSVRWVKGAIFQGERLLYSRNSRNNIELHKCEEDYFVFALDRAIFMLKHTSKIYPEFIVYVNEIENRIGPGLVKDMRDMLTHIDEYAKGGGRHPDKYMHTSKNVSSPDGNVLIGTLTSDVTSTIVFSDRYLIGGRLNVQEAIRVLQEVFPSIESLCMQMRFETTLP
jgi:hypothetical protein